MEEKSKFEKVIIKLAVILFLSYQIIPQIAVVLFAFANKWNSTILPEGYSAKAFVEIASDRFLLNAVGRSLIAAISVAFIDVMVVNFALFYTTVTQNKRAENIMELLSIIPIALPGIVQALGIIKLYGVIAPKLLGTPILLILAQAGFSLPLCFWTMKNLYAEMNVYDLYRASNVLGMSDGGFITRILLPCMKEGIFASAVMAATSSFGDYALAHMIVGAAWETLPIVQNKVMQIDGHKVSAMTIMSNTFIIVLLVVSAKLKSQKEIRYVKK